MVLGVSGIAYGLSRPSPSPAYEGQNDLPTVWSGQLPYFCICMTLNATNLRIVAYLRFWKERRQANRRYLMAASLRKSDKRSRDGRVKRPFNVYSGRVAPTYVDKVCLSPISEGSEHSSGSTCSSVATVQSGTNSENYIIGLHDTNVSNNMGPYVN